MTTSSEAAQLPLAIVLCGSTVAPLIPRRGNFADWFRSGLGDPQALALDAAAGAVLPDPSCLRGAVITGSPAMITENATWMIDLIAWTARAAEAKLPLLGVCFGHQVLARATGGEVGFHPRGREIGSVRVRLEPAAAADPLFGGLPSEFFVQESHSQAVLQLPPGSVHLARGEHDRNQAYRVGPSAWGTQFHPEFDADIIRGYLAERADDLQAEGLDPSALAAATRDDPTGAQLLARFEQLTRTRN